MMEAITAPSTTPSAERAAAAAQCLRYFSESLPLHVADEEESIAPRLRAAGHVSSALDAMIAEHAAHRPLLAKALPLLRELAQAPDDIDTRDRLAPLAAELRAVFEHHLSAEERWFPAVAAWPAAQQEEALREVRARRWRALGDDEP